jgi:putative toxin-antitoxin system antitoxin component (TIGR02293 family)
MSKLSVKRTEPGDAPAKGTSRLEQDLANVTDPRAYKTGATQSFANIYRAAPQEKISVIKQGLSAEHIGALAEVMNMPKEALINTLRLSRATVNRKARSAKALSQDETERVLGVESLIGQVEIMVMESGDPTGFDATKWTSAWLNSPLPALDNKTPASYMDTIEGQKMVSNLLATAQTGAYA